jgi:hypothetical protein
MDRIFIQTYINHCIILYGAFSRPTVRAEGGGEARRRRAAAKGPQTGSGGGAARPRKGRKPVPAAKARGRERAANRFRRRGRAAAWRPAVRRRGGSKARRVTTPGCRVWRGGRGSAWSGLPRR